MNRPGRGIYTLPDANVTEHHPRCPVAYDDCESLVPTAVRLASDGRSISCLRVHDGDSNELAIDLTAAPQHENRWAVG